MESTRKKSCNQCRTAKTRCTLDSPTCSRCERRNLSCKYEHQSSKRHATPPVQDSMFHSWLMETNQIMVPSTENTQHSMPASTGITSYADDRNSAPLDLQMIPSPSSRLFRPSMDWTLDQAIMSMPDLAASPVPDLARPADNRPVSRGDQESLSCWLERSPSLAVGTNDNIQSRPKVVVNTPEVGRDYFSEVRMSMKQSEELALASLKVLTDGPNDLPSILERRKATNGADMMKREFLWSRVVSYATDFEKDTLPPFIHQTLMMKDDDCPKLDVANLPGPLANCRSIVPMYLHKTPACKNLVLKTLLFEVQRLHDEFRSYNERTLLCALQALTVYVIVLAADEEHCNFMGMMTRIAMGEIANAVQNQGYQCAAEMRGKFPKWSDWVIKESTRRTLLVLHILSVLLDIDIEKYRIDEATPCAEFDKLPLPCGDDMWRADTMLVWEQEYKKYLSVRSGSEMLTVGALRQLYKAGSGEAESDFSRDLLRWSKEADDFGAVLLMVA